MQFLYRIRFILIATIALFIGYTVTLQTPPKNSKITIEAAPSKSIITIDGKRAKTGTSTVTNGKHIVTAARAGFITGSQTIVTAIGSTSYIGFTLKPSLESTKTWYTDHPSEQTLAETISGRISDHQTNVATNKNKLLDILPYSFGDGTGGLISISGGIPLEGTTQPAVYIDGASPSARQDALSWIKTSGYDPATVDIVFNATTLFNQTEGE